MTRIRMSEKQFGLFQTPAKSKPVSRIKRRREDLPENQLEGQILTFLRVRGWIVDRQQSGLFSPPWDPARRVRVGEKGCFDWLALRPTRLGGKPISLCETFYLETKAPGAKLNPYQVVWARRRRVVGFLCVVADDLAGFVHWYSERFGK